MGGLLCQDMSMAVSGTIVVWVGLKHSGFESCCFGHHLVIPRWLKCQFNINFENRGYDLDFAAYVLNDDVTHTAPWSSQVMVTATSLCP